MLGGSKVPVRIRWDTLTYLDIERKFTSKLKPRIAGIFRHLRSFEANPVILDECFRELTQDLCKVSRDLPHSKFKKNLKPYWNAELQELKTLKVRAFRIWNSVGRPRESQNLYYTEYKLTKKKILKALPRCAKQYENEEILDAVKLAEVDKNSFWRLLQNCRKNPGHKSLAIKRADGKVVHEIKEVLDVCLQPLGRIKIHQALIQTISQR